MKREFFHAILNPRYKAQRFSNSWDEGLGPGKRLRIAVPEGGAVRQDTALFGVWQRGPRTFTGQCVPSLQERRRVRGSQSGSQRVPRRPRPRPRLGLGKARASPGAGLSSRKVITTCQKETAAFPYNHRPLRRTGTWDRKGKLFQNKTKYCKLALSPHPLPPPPFFKGRED